MCNNSLLHDENYMRAWPRGLQNTVPALASTHHIRQLIKEKQEQQVGILAAGGPIFFFFKSAIEN